MKRTLTFLLGIFTISFQVHGWSQSCPAGSGVYDAIAEGEWAEVSCNTMDDIDPCPAGNCVYSGSGNATDQAAVVGNWNGGAFAENHGQLGTYIAYGGGHFAYHGSEVYEFDLQTRMWTRSEPSTATPINTTYGEWADGDPLAPHTYNRVGYHPNMGSDGTFFVIGTNVDLSCGCYTPYIHYFDLVTQQWSRGDSITSDRGAMVFDYSRNHFIYVPAGGKGYSIYNPLGATLNDRITTYSQASPGFGINSSAAIEPYHDVLVAMDYEYADKLRVLDLDNLTSNFIDVNQVGSGTPVPSAGKMGFEYVASANDGDGAFYAYDGRGRNYLYKLTPPVPTANWQTADWVWTRENALGDIPQSMDAGSEGRLYSRFQWIESLGVFLLVQRTTGPVYAYRPIGSSDPAPTVNLTATPNPVNENESTQLSWTTSNATSCIASGGWSGPRATSGSNETTVALTTDTTFTLTCNGEGGQGSDAVTVTVVDPNPPPTVTLNADDTTVFEGDDVLLTYTISNATSCNGSSVPSSSFDGGITPQDGSETVSNLQTDITFTLFCSNANGNAQDQVSVTVSEPVAYALYNDDDGNFGSGEVLLSNAGDLSGQIYVHVLPETDIVSVRYSVDGSNVGSTEGAAPYVLDGDDGYDSNVMSDGAHTITALVQTSAGTMTLTENVTINNGGGPIDPPPTLSISLNPTAIEEGQSSTLSWDSTNATSCEGLSGITGPLASVDGNQTVSPNSTTIYEIRCTGNGG
ncbi:MAG: hypothetical protein HKM24_02510, partial [Gammaproteobacteria bacterium]|nr:hypothetical protein [Gammaproteobacteria bacterium]